METFRYVVAVLLLLTMPAAIVFWLTIHPFVGFWRRVGVWPAYAVALCLMAFVGFELYWYRDRLLGRDLGTRLVLCLPGGVLVSLSILLARRLREQLQVRTLVGIAELQGDATCLLQGGLYEMVRHPRYLAYAMGTLGAAMIANFTGAWVLALLVIAGLYVVAVLEERELQSRFGPSYREYQQRAPRLLPTVAGLRSVFGRRRGS